MNRREMIKGTVATMAVMTAGVGMTSQDLTERTPLPALPQRTIEYSTGQHRQLVPQSRVGETSPYGFYRGGITYEWAPVAWQDVKEGMLVRFRMPDGTIEMDATSTKCPSHKDVPPERASAVGYDIFRIDSPVVALPPEEGTWRMSLTAWANEAEQAARYEVSCA